MKNSLNEKWIVCRVCLKQPKEQMQTIFSKNDDKDLTRKILECGGVPIKRFDHYPDKICDKCLKLLHVAYRFRITCQRSHKHLSRFIAPVEVEITAENTDEISAEDLLELEPEEEVAELNVKFESETNEAVVKLECSDDELDDIVEMYEPMEDDGGDRDFEDEFEQVVEPVASEASGEIEYLVDLPEEDALSSTFDDEEFLPAKRKTRRHKRGRKPNATKEKPSTSRSAAAADDCAEKKIPKKRGPKPKKSKETAYICDVCGNIYPSQGRLTEHIKLHKGIKPHECEICGHAFAQIQQLSRHMNTHTGNRPYKCSYCPSAFADLSTRNKHHRIHTNERPYVCDVCGKAFTYTNTLKFHKMIHTGEKPHVCDICGKGFQQAYKLRNHKQTHERRLRNEKIEVETLENNFQEATSLDLGETHGRRVILKNEKIEVETLENYQEATIAATQILEI